MKPLLGAVVLSSALLLSVTARATTVTISQPSATTSTSPMTVTATVSDPVRILQLYIDGKKAYEVGATSLNTSVNLSTGTHRVAVQAVDQHDRITKTVKYVTIQSSTTTPPPPPPPPSGTTYDNLQESSSWQTCGSCGNQGGGGALATYSMTRGLTSPTVDGQSTSAQFSIGGSYPYTNAYWYLHNTAPSTEINKLTYDFYIYVPAASATAPQAIEFECQHTVNGYVHNFAWQADYASKQWRTFDFVNRAWISTVIPFTGFAPDTWHHITAEYHEDGSNTVHDALTVDGVRTVVNIVRPAKPTSQSYASFTNAFQLDLNKNPTPFSVYVDKMSVNIQ